MAHSISTTLQRALDLATESYDLYLARTLIAPENARLRHQMEVDLNDTSFSTGELMKELDEERQTLTDLAAHVHDIDQLQEEVSQYIRSKINELYFENNDLRTAQLKREQTNTFLEAVSKLLAADGRISAPQAQVLQHLMDVYDVSIVGALNLQSMVHRYSHGQTSSLIEWAQNSLHYTRGVEEFSQALPNESTPVGSMQERGERSAVLFGYLNKAHKGQRTTVKVTGEEVSQHAKELFRYMLNDMYDFSYEKDEYPHPALMQLAASATLVAGRRVGNRLDSDNPPADEEVVRDVSKEYLSVLGPVMEIFKREPNQLGIYQAFRHLDQQKAEACNVPLDFDKQLRSIHKHAVEQACNALPRAFSQWQRDTRIPVPSSRQFLQFQGLNIGSLERASYTAPAMLKSMTERLEEAQSIEGFVVLAEQMIVNQAHQVAYAANEPSMLLVLKDYVKAMEAGFVAMQRKAGNDTTDLRTHMNDLVALCDHAYQSYRIGREWCMEASNDAYDNPGVEAMMHTCAALGKHYSQLSKAEQEPITEEAARIMRHAGQLQGLDEDLADHPMIPLLYERCMDRAATDYARDHRHEGPLFSDRVATERLGKRAKKKLQDAAFEEESTIRAMAHDLLDRVVAMFPGGELPDEHDAAKGQQPPMRDPQMHAAGVRECIAFFDEAQERGRLH